VRTRLPIALALLTLLAAGTYWAYEAARLYVFRPGLAGWQRYNLLFDTALQAIPVAILFGIFLGALNYRKNNAQIINGKIERHDEWFFIQHWSQALGAVLLLITGFGLGTLFVPRTFQWVETVGFALNMHFIGILFFLFGISYYVTKGFLTGDIKHMMPKKGDLNDMIGHYKAMILRKAAPKEGKFLSAERVVFPMWIVAVGGITITGIIKVLAHVWSLPSGLMGATTFLHGIFSVLMLLMLVAHVFAGALLPASWPLIRSMLTGNVTEEYVKSHHEKWYEEIKNQEPEPEKDPGGDHPLAG
jgi:formate dehydrogenase subunit gamma